MSMSVLGPLTTKGKIEEMISYCNDVLKKARNGDYNQAEVNHALRLSGELTQTLDGDPDFSPSKEEAERVYKKLRETNKEKTPAK